MSHEHHNELPRFYHNSSTTLTLFNSRLVIFSNRNIASDSNQGWRRENSRKREFARGRLGKLVFRN